MRCTQLNETAITRQIKQILFQVGYFPIKIAGGPYQKPGIADLLVCGDGKFIAIEVKKPGGRLSPLQEQFLHDVRAAGGVAFVAYSIDDVVRELKLNVKLYPLLVNYNK
jgi:hypothetical protein